MVWRGHSGEVLGFSVEPPLLQQLQSWQPPGHAGFHLIGDQCVGGGEDQGLWASL